MKYAKTVLALGLLLAVCNTSMGLALKTLPEDHPDDLEMKFKFQNWDDGNTYVPTSTWLATHSEGDDLVLTGTKLDAVKAGTDPDAFVVAAAAAVPGEDSWGLFRLQEIQGWDGSAYTRDLYDIDDDAGDVPPGDADDVLGIFGGIVDKHVTLTWIDDKGTATPADDIFEQEIWAAGDNAFVRLHENADGSMVLQNPGARSGAQTYPTFTDGTLLLDMALLPDELSGAPLAGMKFLSSVRLDFSGGVVNNVLSPGLARMVIDIVGGTGASSNGGPFQDNVDRDGDPATEDIIFLTNVFGDTTGLGWRGNTDDPAFGGNFIPEPLTMVAVMLSVTGLGGYIRKRRS